MSLKVGFCIFYVAFLTVILAFSTLIGSTAQSALGLSVEQAQLIEFPAPPESGTFDSILYPFQIVIYAIGTFGFLATVTSEFALLATIMIPYTIGFIWAFVELIRGN